MCYDTAITAGLWLWAHVKSEEGAKDCLVNIHMEHFTLYILKRRAPADRIERIDLIQSATRSVSAMFDTL
jgi:hypothetical protein